MWAKEILFCALMRCFNVQTSEKTFVSDVRHILLNFLMRSEKQAEGQRKTLLESYLVGLSNKSLVLPLKVRLKLVVK